MKKTALATMLFLTFAATAIAGTTNVSMTNVEPRIFSPEENMAGVNRVRFFLDNPDSSEINIRIFDLTGTMVRGNIERESETADGTVLFWDGRDQSGNVVKSGIYIYQIEADSKIMNGTIVVAR
jgi:flagellar hook assembly protein FlgD